MTSKHCNAFNSSIAVLAVTLASGATLSTARAQAGVNPDGSMWVNTGTGSTWTNPNGSVKLDKEGHVIDVSPNCKDVRSINVQQAKHVCWKTSSGKYMWFDVGYVLYTCFDTNVSAPKRITSYVQNTGQPCDPVQEATDRGEAQMYYEETWPVTEVTFPPTGGGGNQTAGGGTPTNGGDNTQTTGGGSNQPPNGGGSQPTGGTGTQTAGGDGTNTGTGEQPTKPGLMSGGWPEGADWITPAPNGGWIIHYPDGRLVEQAALSTPEQQPRTETIAPTNTPGGGQAETGGGKLKHPKKAEPVKKTTKTTSARVNSSTQNGPAGPSPATVDMIGIGLGLGLQGIGMGMDRGMRGGNDGMMQRGMKER
jgi:hypothetical protein